MDSHRRSRTLEPCQFLNLILTKCSTKLYLCIWVVFGVCWKPKRTRMIWTLLWRTGTIRTIRKEIWKRGPVMNPPDRRQAWEAPSHTYSNWTFIPTTIRPLSEDKKVILSSQWLIRYSYNTSTWSSWNHTTRIK